jgi:hypothetical protein
MEQGAGHKPGRADLLVSPAARQRRPTLFILKTAVGFTEDNRGNREITPVSTKVSDPLSSPFPPAQIDCRFKVE